MPLTSKSPTSTDRIVQAAGKLFARQGYHGTTTREIARSADVSENTLFRHFDNKEDLFWATLRSHSMGLRLRRDLLESMERCDPPKTVLPKILEMFEDLVNYRTELLGLVAVAFLELHPKADGFCLEHFSPLLTTIRQYLETSIGKGTIRDLDPAILTSALMMTALMHPRVYRLFGAGNSVSFSSLDAHRANARFWLEMLAPRTPAKSESLAQARDDLSREFA